jgi:serine phosphatase RsbU (regulator of sigma subunit)
MIGRAPPSEIILADSEISRGHCRVALQGDDLVVTDLNSTNGTFVDGSRVLEPTHVPVGAVVQLGRQILKHEWRTRREILQSEEFDRDLDKANSYIQALLPPPLTEGAIVADWRYEPCAKLGGDAFGYGWLSDHQFAAYLIDVSGHGAGAALHSVAVMNLLRQRALPNVDMSRPSEVLSTLNAMFQMEHHAEMYFTMWYGVYDTRSRQLDFACAGHHPAYLVSAERDEATPLRARNGMIGAVPQMAYRSESATVPPGASVYLFSDGAFEIVTADGREWSLQDFLPLIVQRPVAGLSECERLFREVTGAARPGGFDDDFSLVVLTFN